MTSLRSRDAYWHLSRSLFVGTGDLMGILSSYFDDSGTDAGSRTAVVAGYVGSDFQWKRFADRWTTALAAEHVSVMRRSSLENFKGEFLTGWNDSRRTAFVKRLHSIIKTCTYSAVAAVVVKEDFERVMPRWVHELMGGPYGWCAFMCVFAMRGWCQEKNHSGPVNWIFESGTEGAQQVMQMFQAIEFAGLKENYQVGALAFAGKEVKPLQAADLVAYETFKHAENQILDQGRLRKQRGSAIDLFRPQDERHVTFWNEDRLRHWLKICDRRLPSFEVFSTDELDELRRLAK